MAKPQKKPEPLRARKSITAKAPPAKAPSAKAAARLPLAKASAVKAPPTKARAGRARGWEPTSPNPPAAKGGKHPAPEVARASSRRGASAVEPLPATEAQIVEALAGKLSAPGAGPRAGLSWLAAAPKSNPEVVEPQAPPAPAPALGEANVADLAVPAVNAEDPVAENLNVATLKTEEPTAEAITEAPRAELSVAGELRAEEPKAPEPRTGSADVKEWLSPAAANERSLSKQLKATANRIGWILTVQAALFVAFCVMAAKDAPLSGLQSFLLGGIPLFAMVLISIDLMGLSASQSMLDTLEGERLAFQRLQRMLSDPGGCADSVPKPDSFAAARRLAFLPSLIILGILLVVWLVLGLTVWFL